MSKQLICANSFGLGQVELWWGFYRNPRLANNGGVLISQEGNVITTRAGKLKVEYNNDVEALIAFWGIKLAIKLVSNAYILKIISN